MKSLYIIALLLVAGLTLSACDRSPPLSSGSVDTAPIGTIAPTVDITRLTDDELLQKMESDDSVTIDDEFASLEKSLN